MRKTWRRRGSRTLAALTVAITSAIAFVPSARGKSVIMDDDEDPPPVVSGPAVVSSGSFGSLVGLSSIVLASKSPDAKTRAAAIARAAELGGTTAPAIVQSAASASASASTSASAAASAPASPVSAVPDESWRVDAWKIVEGGASDSIGEDPDGALMVRLVAARALASSFRKEQAVQALRALFSSPTPALKATVVAAPAPPPWGPPWSPPPPVSPPRPTRRADPELVRFVRDSAALSLALQGDFEVLIARARAKDDADASRSALAALTAVPPTSLMALFPKANQPLKIEHVELLARLGDLRAAETLHGVARSKDEWAVSVAVLGLARLGDGRVVPIAIAALAAAPQGAADSRLRVAAAEALAELGEPAAEAAILSLAAVDKTKAEANRLAIAYPTAGLVALLAPLARAGNAQAIAALGRVGDAGVETLAGIARSDEMVATGAPDVAAHALALSPASGVDAALAALLDGAPAERKRRAVRAGAVRAARSGAVGGALESAAKSFLSSNVEADRWVGTQLLCVLSLGETKSTLASDDVVRRRAAAVALAAHPVAAAAAVARARLAASPTDDAEVILQLVAVAARAVDGSVAHDVPIATSTLAIWLAEDSRASALAAYLLAARGGEAVRAHVARALGSDDLSVRSAALLGLGLSPDPSATGELSVRLAELPLSAMRRAAARALAARGDPASTSVLALAHRIDPDADVRALAQVPIGKNKTYEPASPLLRGREVIQAHVVSPSGVKGTIIASLATPDGMAFPAFADPDGFLVIFRVAAGVSRLDVRPAVSKAPAAP